MQQQIFTRKELYDLVWSMPIMKLAEQFGLSDRGLSKTCLRHQIPVPGRGYWARLAAGQKVSKTPLRKMQDPALEIVRFSLDRQSAKSEQTKNSVLMAQQHVTLPIADTIGPPPRIKKLHRSVAPISKLLRTTRPSLAYGDAIIAAGVRVHKSSIARVIYFLQHLEVCLAANGMSLHFDGATISIKNSEIHVPLEIKELRRRRLHEPTAKEREREKRYKQSLKKAGQEPLDLDGRHIFSPRYDLYHTGRLEVTIGRYSKGLKNCWRENDNNTLEKLMEPMLRAALAQLERAKIEEEESAQEQERRERLQHRRALQLQRNQREDRRLTFLQHVAEVRKAATDLRATIDASELFREEASAEYLRMIEWAKLRLASIEIQSDMSTLTNILQEQDLFPENDPLADPEGDPPEYDRYDTALPHFRPQFRRPGV